MSDWVVTTTRATVSKGELPSWVSEKICRRFEIDDSEVPEWAKAENSSSVMSGAEKHKISKKSFEKIFSKKGKEAR